MYPQFSGNHNGLWPNFLPIPLYFADFFVCHGPFILVTIPSLVVYCITNGVITPSVSRLVFLCCFLTIAINFTLFVHGVLFVAIIWHSLVVLIPSSHFSVHLTISLSHSFRCTNFVSVSLQPLLHHFIFSVSFSPLLHCYFFFSIPSS